MWEENFNAPEKAQNADTQSNPGATANRNKADQRIYDQASKHNALKRGENTEPDWNEIMRNAPSMVDKWKVMEAKKTYEEERNRQAWQEHQEARNQRIQQIQALPQHTRTKAFYEKLAQTSGSLYFAPEIQRLKANDRKVLGLGFHLKGTS